MAAFNEAPQDKGGIDIPSMHFPYMSREISNLTPDRSKEFLYQGLGKAMEQGAQLADKTYDLVVKNDTYSQVAPAEKEYQDRLQSVDDQLTGTKNASGLDPNSSSLLSQTAQQYGNLPGDLKTLPRTLDTWDSARANGKLSETQHYRNIVDIATRLRNKYPGKTDLIDAEISRVTGVHPANQYVRSLLGDINSFVEADKTNKNKFETRAFEAMKAGDLDYSTYQKAVQTGNEALVYQEIAKRGRQKAQHEEASYAHQEQDWTNEEKLRDAKSLGTTKAYTAASNFFDTLRIGSGIDDSNPKQLSQIMSDMAQGKYEYDPEQIASQFNIGINQWESKLRRDFNTVLPGQDKSLAARLGGEETEKIIKAAKTELENWRDAIKKGDLDVATLAARQIKGLESRGELALLQDKGDVGEVTRNLVNVKNLLGNEAFTEFYHNNTNAFTVLNSKDSTKFAADATKLVLPPGKFGTSDSFSKQLKDAQAQGVSNPKYYDQYINLVQGLLEKNVPDDVKNNVVNKVFGVGNDDTITLFNKDTINSKGMPVPGQYSVYDRLVSPQATDKIWKAAANTNRPETFANYQSWAEHSFGTLFRNELHDLSVSKTDYSGVDIGYDPQNHKFMARPNPYPPQTGNPSSYYGQEKTPPELTRLINRVNSAVYNLNHIYEKSNQGNTDIYLYKLLTGSGLGSDISEKMLDAVVKAHSSSKPSGQ